MLTLVLVLALLSSVQTKSTNAQKCVLNPGPLPVNVLLEGCTKPPCVVQPGGDAVLHLTFAAPHLITSMETLVTVDTPGLGPLQFPLEHYAATCKFLTNRRCPVPAGEALQYSLRLNMPAFLPRITVVVEVYVVDQHKNILLCVRIPVKIP